MTFTPSGMEGYADLTRSAKVMSVGRIEVRVAGLADVIRSKTAAGRPKDREALPELRSINERLTDKS